MRKPVKEQQLLWHLTDINNLDSILKNGLLSRKLALEKSLISSDVADQEIIEKRKDMNLLQYVPFHLFCKNPFDGRVIKDHPDCDFCYITIKRDRAKELNAKILTKHPLAQGAELKNYDDGFAAIDWDLLEKREYSDKNCKFTCMAEVLLLDKVNVADFNSIATYDETLKNKIKTMADTVIGSGNYYFHIDNSPQFFAERNK